MSDTEEYSSEEKEEITLFEQNKKMLKLEYRFYISFIDPKYKGRINNIKNQIFKIEDEELFNKHITRFDELLKFTQKLR